MRQPIVLFDFPRNSATNTKKTSPHTFPTILATILSLFAAEKSIVSLQLLGHKAAEIAHHVEIQVLYLLGHDGLIVDIGDYGSHVSRKFLVAVSSVNEKHLSLRHLRQLICNSGADSSRNANE